MNPIEPEIVDPGDTGSGRFAREAESKANWKSQDCRPEETGDTKNAQNTGNAGFDFRKYLSATRRQLTIRGTLALLAGLVLVLVPNLSIISAAVLVRVAGILTAVGAFLGIWRLLRRRFADWQSLSFLSLCVSLLCGLAAAASPVEFMSYIIQFFGLYLAFAAIFFPFLSRRNFGFKEFLQVLLGFFIAYNPFMVLRFTAVSAGILLILFGSTLLLMRSKTGNV